MFYASKVGRIFMEISIKNPPRIGEKYKFTSRFVAIFPKLFTFL